MGVRGIQMKYTIDNPKLVKYHRRHECNNFTGVVKDSHGAIAYYENGELHRANGPAIILIGGTNKWYIRGKCHREDGPAIEYANGEKRWWYNNEFYGHDNDFTIDSWIKKWKLEIFK